MNAETNHTERLITLKRVQAQNLAKGIEEMLIARAEEIRQYSLTAGLVRIEIDDYIESDGKLSPTNACKPADDIRDFGYCSDDYFDRISSDTQDLLDLLRELKKLELEKERTTENE
ncbi:hypothetical protein [Varibaculum cambriense]|uniref:hypothetical protein n=1 Tax=Varibaculum cambriense TaxID=184870 RepID=UPI0028FF8FA7|nr:hypothetical protein [Varibaculum cambriense]MDU1225119.1 hypothetical protein [Varibaculum cambriense]